MVFRSLVLILIGAFSLTAPHLQAACKVPPIAAPSRPPEMVYDKLPFAPGEFSRMKVSYLGMNAGFMEFRVLNPAQINGVWNMAFEVLVETGEWYEKIFKARDEGFAFTRPDFVATKFRVTQNHKELIGKGYVEDKLLEFDVANCDVTEIYRDPEGKTTKSVHAEMEPDATDILGALYKLRTYDFIRNKEARIKVYTSEKNWWLTATREDFVMLTVPNGKHKAVRLNLQTFIGKELQQKGRARLWIAYDEPQRRLLKIEADIKIGSFIVVLADYEQGKKVEQKTKPN